MFVLLGAAQAPDNRSDIRFRNQAVPAAEAFLEDVIKTLQEEDDPGRTRASVDVALHDLDGDGVAELFVRYTRTGWCSGSSGACDISVFRRSQTSWKFIGDIGVYEWTSLLVGAERNHGWPELIVEYKGDVYWKYCWVRSFHLPQGKSWSKGPGGFVPQEGQSGYFASVEADKPCPKD